jgi:outer membrane lipoprotein SlyB
MNTPSNLPPDSSKPPGSSRPRLHPLVATAAGAIIVASLVAVAAITGVLPGAKSVPSNAAGTTAEQTAATNTGSPNDAGAPPLHGDSAAPATPEQAPAPNDAQANAPAPAPPPAQAQVVQPAPAPASPVPQPPPSAQQYNPANQANPAPTAPVAQANGQGQPAQPQRSYCASCGTITSIQEIKVEGHGTGIGAVGGAVVGGLVGNQFGGGSGRTAMTVLGAVGGGFGGNAVEKKVRSSTQYRVYVRTEDGRTRYFTYQQPPPFRNGDRVRVQNDTLVGG